MHTLLPRLNLVAPYVGAWIETIAQCVVNRSFRVAPYVGAWIETGERCRVGGMERSHPTWVRGLKLVFVPDALQEREVAPYVGAWIETVFTSAKHFLIESHPTWVRGLKLDIYDRNTGNTTSHPTWVRGLKLYVVCLTLYIFSRTLRGCVD